jgi:hypothetical protein
MPTELALVDGTKLTLTDENVKPDDVLEQLARRQSDRSAGFVAFETTEGTYRVHPSHIVSVRWLDAAEGPMLEIL